MTYRGRFAPSPSGQLHFGSLIAALASYLQARSNNGVWLVRIEDVDLPRSMLGADKDILKTLEHLGLHWDESVIYQSQKLERYTEIISDLNKQDLLFPCSCSRKEIANEAYSCKCRNGIENKEKKPSMRIKVDKGNLGFIDQIQGEYFQNLKDELGDFIIKRADSITSYNLAVVVDDADQEISEIVRGCDLLNTTPRQIFLQELLNFNTPSYVHFPIAVDVSGKKLSKQNHAPEIDLNNDRKLMFDALTFLGQSPEMTLSNADISDILKWGIEHWDINKIPIQKEIFYKI